MNVKAKETLFFYKIDGTLRQEIELEIENPSSAAVNVEAVISTNSHGACSYKISRVESGKSTVKCYAPVVFPNLADGKHRPVKAELLLADDRQLFKGEIVIGRHRPWTIYICQDICTDFTWGLPYDQTIEASGDMICTQLDQMDRTDKENVPSRNCWNMNQTMEVDWFVENRSPEDIERLFRREREGRIEISATYNSNLSAMLGTEQAIRSLYYARELWKKYNVTLSTLEHIEMPTITWGMMSIYARAGIKYFTKPWLDFNNHHLQKSDDIPLFYWEGPDGKSVLAFMDKGANLRSHYGQANFFSGSFLQKPLTYPEILEELHGWWIPHYENNTEYPFDCFMMLGAYIDLHVNSKFEVEALVNNIIKYNNEPWEYPRIVNATWSRYFENVTAFAAENGISIPAVSGDMGISWEDWPAHYAHVAAQMKRGVEDYITVEKLSALQSILSGSRNIESAGLLASSVKLMNQLAEHPWNGTNDDEKYRSLAKRTSWTKELNNNNRKLLDSFMSGMLGNQDVASGCVKVVNMLPWERDGEVLLDAGSIPEPLIEKMDGMYQPVEEFGAGKLSFIVKEVPSFGYCSMGKYTPSGSRVKAIGNTLENGFYKLAVNLMDGSIESLWDKKNGCELINCKEGMGLNQYLYDSDRNIYRLENISVRPINAGIYRASLLIEGETLRSCVTTIITMYSDLDKISIANKVSKEPSSEPLNIYFAFPLNISEREYHYECTASIIKPGLKEFGGDNLRGSGQEVYSVRNFMDVSNNNMGVTLSPYDSYLFQLGRMTYDIMPDFPCRDNATVYSLVMTNHAYAEILRDQGRNRDFSFGYTLTSHKGGFKPEEAMRFGWEENNKLIGIPVRNNCIAAFGDSKKSFIKIMNENIIATAFKYSEDADGSYILRLWETAGKDTVARIDAAALGFTSARGCDIIERDNGAIYRLQDGMLNVPVGAWGIETVRLYGLFNQ